MASFRGSLRVPPFRNRTSVTSVEPSVRRLVAHHLGVDSDELVANVSLREDLAADSLDLAELVLALEGEFEIVVRDVILDAVYTYDDLVRATARLVHRRRRAEAREGGAPERVRARILPSAQRASGVVERTGWLTPYVAETIAEDAMHAGPGARLELTVASATADAARLAQVEHRFARLEAHGVQVVVHGDGRPS
jgi:acyl carrier protein